MTAAAVFGGDMLGVDVSTDMCAFLRPEDLQDLGAAKIADPQGFARCAIEVAAPAGPSTIYAGRFFDVAAKPVKGPPKTLAGGLKEYGGGSARNCASQVVFPDNVGLRVYATGPADPCPLVRRAIDAMIGRFDDGTAPPRPVPANSLERLDACSLLPADVSKAVPGASPGREPQLDRHICSSGPSFRAYGVLALVVGYPPAAGGASVGEVIAGRQTVVATRPRADGGKFYCEARTSVRPLDNKDLPGAMEYAVAEVGWFTEPEDCSAAKALAGMLWPALPPV
ncbi:hypothetical protein [Actinokineospora xionganensis]|uniref:Uncharacterized protein n=1 Tax=Actinokineospora xionganensis TaxID=2684470 RepID=A0ABR7L2U8_9PSEU|nr:hypothetical protein [Actinokineospora xionganensis]MBC6447014.1 hypothetical protein [Actinokineospora xionganensis]